jgi:hypothetical protein
MKHNKTSQNQLKLGFSDKSSVQQREASLVNTGQGKVISFDPRQDIYKKILNRKME